MGDVAGDYARFESVSWGVRFMKSMESLTLFFCFFFIYLISPVSSSVDH